MSARIPPPMPSDLAGVVDDVLANSRDRVLVITPLLFQPSDGLAGRIWYFMVCSCAKRHGFTVLQVIGDEADRMALIAALIARKRIVVNVMDDELRAIRLCETLWPCEHTARIRATIEAERAVGGSP